MKSKEIVEHMSNSEKWINGAKGKEFLASFSGGKDSVLALYYAMQEGKAIGLIVMMEEEGQRSRSHGLTPEILDAQGRAIGLPIYKGSATWENYEEVFKKLLKDGKNKGAKVLVTGDLDMPEYGCWHEKVTKEVGLELAMPLWNMNHREEVKEFINLGFVTKIVTVNLNLGMREEDLGKILTKDYIKELEQRGIDPCGEGGEFHTIVIDGPIFNTEIPVKEGEITRQGEYAFLSLTIGRSTNNML